MKHGDLVFEERVSVDSIDGSRQVGWWGVWGVGCILLILVVVVWCMVYGVWCLLVLVAIVWCIVMWYTIMCYKQSMINYNCIIAHIFLIYTCTIILILIGY